MRQTLMTRFSGPVVFIFFWAFLSAEGRAGSIVAEGFNKFTSNGGVTAVATWSRQSRLLNDTKISQLTSELKKIESTLGACEGFDILNTLPLGSQDNQIFAVGHFNYGSVFFRFLVFQDKLGQQYINGIWFATDPWEIIPPKLAGLWQADNRRNP